jgi:hypothetical protein
MRIWTCWSSLASSRSARGSNRIDQAKARDHVVERKGLAFRVLDSLEGQVVILEILEVLEDSFADVEGLRASGFLGQGIEPSFDIFGEPDRKRHAIRVSQIGLLVKDVRRRIAWHL